MRISIFKGGNINPLGYLLSQGSASVVGVDIGCGMYTVNLGKQKIDLEKFDMSAFTIPSGREVWEGRIEKFDLTELRCYRQLKEAKRLERSLELLEVVIIS